MNRYRLKQDGVVVAFAMGNEAEREIMHYAATYSQDGPLPSSAAPQMEGG